MMNTLYATHKFRIQGRPVLVNPLEYELLVGYTCRQAVQDKLTGPLEVLLHFQYARAKRMKHTTPGRGYGDLDNLVDAVVDGMTGIAFTDKSQIMRIEADKAFGNDAHVEVEIREVQE